MHYGYTGRILKVDLSTGSWHIEHKDESFYRTYMGGSALNMHYMLHEMQPGVDPFSPDNLLCFSVGVTTGVPISGQSRLTITAKSPLTGLIGDSQSGGYFPAEMKFAGFDAVIIRGKAPKPVYLSIMHGKAELRDATELQGKQTADVERMIRQDLGDERVKIAQCGPAGERLVRFAAVISNANRANGRTGMGAVMGSKNLRAIAVRGTERPNIKDREAVTALAKEGARRLPGSDLEALGRYGTAGIIEEHQVCGGLPTMNFNQGVFDEGWETISGKALWDSYRDGREEGKQNSKGRASCFGCIIRCKPVVRIDQGKHQADPVYGGPEYESIATFGSYCGVSDMAAIAEANQLCNANGLDTISCGATIAWAMECFENGLITLETTGGLELTFGNADAMVETVRRIVNREGFGDVLAEGSEAAANALGLGHEYLLTSKGMEAPAHMPQLKRSLAVIYATNPFGSDHQSHEHDPFYEGEDFEAFRERLSELGLPQGTEAFDLGPEKIRFTCRTQQHFSFLDSACLCQFAWGPAWELYGAEDISQLFKAVTGWDVSVEEQLEVGERRLNMMRAFNAREGVGRERDTLPAKFFDKPLAQGPTKGLCLDRQEFEDALSEYYRQSGWDTVTGNPLAGTYARLGLDWVADMLGLARSLPAGDTESELQPA